MAKGKKRMRLPNGIGSVHKINDGKRRRKPWRARVPSHVEFVNGVARQKYINLGYYETETEAIEALFEYRKNPYTLEASTATFAEVFEMWSAKKYPEISKSGAQSYNAAFKQSEALHNMKMRDIRTMHMENIMQTTKVGYSSQTALKTLWGLLFKYSIEHDIVQKNYAEFIKTRDKDEGTTRDAIPDEDIQKIWEAAKEGDSAAEIAMMYIYTGMRLTELLELNIESIDLEARILVGGKKTEAGKNRKIPIHKCILPFIEKRMNNESGHLVESESKRYRGKAITGAAFTRNYWEPLMERLGIENCTPHYARHTCATMLRVAGVEEDLRKLILGHSRNNITDRYTHIPDSMLVEAIDKLPSRE